MEIFALNSTKRRWLILPLLIAALFFAGCNLQVINLTPTSMKANPSGTYTISVQILKKRASTVIDGTIRPEIIIDGASNSMTLAPGSDDIWEYEYEMPQGRNSASYYVIVKYDIKSNDGFRTKEAFIDVTPLTVEQRYSVELEVDRAPVGTKVAILGRGFDSTDKVTVGGIPAPARLESPTSLAFYVPSLDPGRNYEVKVLGPRGEINAGTLRIDASQIYVTPGSISLTTGQRMPVIFHIPDPAPPGGLRIRVRTDVPKSVIMDVVTIQAGMKSTSVPVEGGLPGVGNLFVEVPGYSEVVVPVSVQ